MRRDLYTDDHEQYRDTVRAFLAREVEPHFLQWGQDRVIDKAVFRTAAAQGAVEKLRELAVGLVVRSHAPPPPAEVAAAPPRTFAPGSAAG